MKTIIELILRLGTVDRRWIFLVIAFVVLIPLFFPMGLPIRATPTTQQVYDTIDKLPHGSKVLLSCEYGPSTKPEIHPMTLSVLRHLFKNKHKVYVTCLWQLWVLLLLSLLLPVCCISSSDVLLLLLSHRSMILRLAL